MATTTRSTSASADEPTKPRRRDINRSPIYKKWVKLHLVDIFSTLKCIQEYTPDSIYFFNNHPVRWIQIFGLVITKEEQEKRILYTIDDGSGYVINAIVKRNYNAILDARLPKVQEMVKIKGTLEIAHEEFQMKVLKIEGVTGFEEQVGFWKEANRIRDEILVTPSVRSKRKASTTLAGNDRSKRKENRS
ncbi:hypothetical protein ABW19_dt0200931 [Dactylella cylindrospora]|nr:hypothetical protein ABW19_dt0200931 [Dactylella cylindrospora]